MAMTITCKRCGASCQSINVADVVRWDVSHDEACPTPPTDTDEKDGN